MKVEVGGVEGENCLGGMMECVEEMRSEGGCSG